MTRTIAIIGAGPVGLAAAAHALQRGLEPVIIEQGAMAGHAVRQWSHVAMFSNWAFNVDRAAEHLLRAAGWNAPDPDAFPTGGELLARYLEPLAALPALRDRIRLRSEVLAVSRRGLDKARTADRTERPFVLRVEGPAGEADIEADAVIDASGTWSQPSPAGSSGLPARGEGRAARRIAYGMPDVAGAARARYAGRRVAVLGGGHSAIGTLVELAKLAVTAPGTQVHWLYRGSDASRAFGGGEADQLAARGALGTAARRLLAEGRVDLASGFTVAAIEDGAAGLCIAATDGRVIEVDELVVATGFRPDLSFLREVRIALDPALECPPTLAPLIDPNLHSCGTVRPHGARELAHPETGFYIAGMKAYGRAPTFLLATGYEQVRSIVAEIAGDHVAAARVELVLPETGVCAGPTPAASACCGGPPTVRLDACCAEDERARDAGADDCGCASEPRVLEHAGNSCR
jgi:thioredoxin reductase